MKALATFLLVTSLMTSCGVTQVTVSRPDVDIYINNVKKGKGSAELKRLGPPQRSKIVAKYEGETVGEALAKRKFNWVTLIIGMHSYGLGFGLAWMYPSSVHVPISMPEYILDSEAQDNDDTTSRWMKPPKVWGTH